MPHLRSAALIIFQVSEQRKKFPTSIGNIRATYKSVWHHVGPQYGRPHLFLAKSPPPKIKCVCAGGRGVKGCYRAKLNVILMFKS